MVIEEITKEKKKKKAFFKFVVFYEIAFMVMTAQDPFFYFNLDANNHNKISINIHKFRKDIWGEKGKTYILQSYFKDESVKSKRNNEEEPERPKKIVLNRKYDMKLYKYRRIF